MSVKVIAIVTVAALAFVAGAASFSPAEIDARIGEVRATQTVPRPHPRLFATPADIEILKRTINDEKLAGWIRDRVLFRAESLIGKPFLKREVTGRRLLHISRAAVSRIAHIGLAYRLTDEERFARRGIDEALAISAFANWNPSHFLDVGEMTHAAALAYDWFYWVMTPDERRRIASAIVEKGLRAGRRGNELTGVRPWMRCDTNWGQVCMGGLAAGAAAVLEEYPDESIEVLACVSLGMKTPMEAFVGGGFPEGPYGYWDYAMTYNAIGIAAIESACGTDFGLCDLAGFREQADYPDLTTGPEGECFNFFDAGHSVFAPRGVQMPCWWLAHRFGRSDTLVRHEAPLLAALCSPDKPDKEVWNGAFLPFILMWYTMPGGNSTTAMNKVFGGVNPAAVMRTGWRGGDWFVGIRGGRAELSHGHQDAGSFVLDAKGVRWSLDLGCEDYHRIESGGMGLGLWDMRQNSPRWTLFRYRNIGHSTITFGERPQVVNATAIVSESDSAPVPTVAVDLTPVLPYAKKVTRSFALAPRGELVVEDAVSGGKPGDAIVWRMNTAAIALVDGSRATLTQRNRAGVAQKLVLEADGGVWCVKELSQMLNALDSPLPGVRQLILLRTVGADGSLVVRVTLK